MRQVTADGRRRIVAPKFGAQLRRLRGRQSRGEVCRALATKHLKVDRSTIMQYERGTVRAPSIAVLWTLAQHYGLKDHQFCALIQLLTHELLGRSGAVPSIESHDLETRRLASIFRGFPAPLKKAVMVILTQMQSADPQVARLLMSSRRGKHEIRGTEPKRRTDADDVRHRVSQSTGGVAAARRLVD